MKSGDVVRVIDTAVEGLALPIVEGEGAARAVLWPGNGGRFRSLNLVELGSGSSTTALSHATDCVYYVISGSGRIVDLASGASQPLVEGSMVHIDAGDGYRFAPDGEGLRLVGGPCPPDAAFYAFAQSQAAIRGEA